MTRDSFEFPSTKFCDFCPWLLATVLSLLRLRPQYAAEIWKRSFISSPTVHTNPSPQPSFSKTLYKLEEFKKPALFRVDGKHFENEAFRKPDGVTIIVWFPWPRFPQTQIQNDQWLLGFWIPPAKLGLVWISAVSSLYPEGGAGEREERAEIQTKLGRQTFDSFSMRNRFQILAA